MTSPGARLRSAWSEQSPLQIVGTINAYTALLAERAGHRALYLSGAGVANASFGCPDLGITSLNDVCEDARRITGATDLPLLVDADTGWGGAFNIARSVRDLVRSGAAGAHIEDQVGQKRCGHRPNKAIVPLDEMLDRIKSAVDARTDEAFVVMARTDALASQGMEEALERARRCVEHGADAIFAEAVESLDQYRAFVEACAPSPVLANITEFGRTPLFTLEELRQAGVGLALYPLSAFRAMSRAAERVYAEIAQGGTQQPVVETMQTRDELYEVLGYHGYERKLDELFGKENT